MAAMKKGVGDLKGKKVFVTAATKKGVGDLKGKKGFVKAATQKSVGDLKRADLKGKRVLDRVYLNVPLDENQKITDDTRVRDAVHTIKHLMRYDAKVILMSHLGRPKGVTPKYSLKPLVPRLSELLGTKVEMADDCIGEGVEKMVAALPNGGVLLLENVRFYKEEEKNDPEFAKKLASLGDLYVNDVPNTAHRAHASTEGVAKFLKPAVAGFLRQKPAAVREPRVAPTRVSDVGRSPASSPSSSLHRPQQQRARHGDRPAPSPFSFFLLPLLLLLLFFLLPRLSVSVSVSVSLSFSLLLPFLLFLLFLLLSAAAGSPAPSHLKPITCRR